MGLSGCARLVVACCSSLVLKYFWCSVFFVCLPGAERSRAEVFLASCVYLVLKPAFCGHLVLALSRRSVSTLCLP